MITTFLTEWMVAKMVNALKCGAELAKELNFQYIVTMNEHDAFKEKIDGFDLREYKLPVILTADKVGQQAKIPFLVSDATGNDGRMNNGKAPISCFASNR